MTKTGTKFEAAKIANKDGTPAIGTVVRVNRWGAIFYSLTVDGRTAKGGSMYFVPQGQAQVVRRWL